MNLNYRILIKIMGLILTVSGISLLPTVVAAHIYDSAEVMRALLISAVIMLTLGLPAAVRLRLHTGSLKLREGYIVVTFSWVVISILGALPYYLCGYADTFIDAFFESTAGFTTTGCTVLNMEYMPRGLLLWKAITHWLGGMGILVFVISILPTLGAGGQRIVKAEAPGPKLEKLATRISSSTKILYVTYLTFTLVEFILLAASPHMNAFDSLINAMGSISTGGLFTHAQGIAYYDSFYIEAVIAISTVLSSVNFMLYLYLLQGRWRDFFRDIELRAFLVILACSILLVTAGLYFHGTYESLLQSFRCAFFQVIAFATSSGYTLTDFSAWPSFCLTVMFVLLFIGGCAASTCGSIKVIRILVLFKLIGRGIYKRIHPRAVVAVKLGGKTLSALMVSQITAFIIVYFATFLFASLVLSLQGLDMTTTVSAAAAALSNTGIGLGEMTTGDFSIFSGPLKLFLSFLMICGRLELFTVIMLLTPSFWNSDR